MTRAESLMPGGVPKWIRCYFDPKEPGEAWTVIYTKADKWGGPGLRGTLQGRGMSSDPCSPQGVGMFFEVPACRDGKPTRLRGRRIAFADLPPDCRALVLRDYREIWKLDGAA